MRVGHLVFAVFIVPACGARETSIGMGGASAGGSSAGAGASSLGDAAAVCAPDWALAERPETWCSLPPYGSASGLPPTARWWNVGLIRDCMGYDIVIANQADNGTACFYDAAIGKLVAVAQAAGTLAPIAGELPFNDLSVCGDAMPPNNLCVPSDASSGTCFLLGPSDHTCPQGWDAASHGHCQLEKQPSADCGYLRVPMQGVDTSALCLYDSKSLQLVGGRFCSAISSMCGCWGVQSDFADPVGCQYVPDLCVPDASDSDGGE